MARGDPANRVSGLQFVDNDVVAAPGAAVDASTVAFKLRASRDVRIENNRFRLAKPVTVATGKSVEGLVLKNNLGLVSPP